MAVLFSCSERSVTERELIALNKAITAIEDRKESEIYIIEEETTSLKLIESNLEKANSEGMREKMRRDISVKKSVVAKAELNKSNQEKILMQLFAKRDSLLRTI